MSGLSQLYGHCGHRLQKIRRDLAACFLGLLSLTAPGCNKGPYGFVTVLDHSVFDNQFYVLLLLEEGVNKAFRYAPHGDSFEAKRQVLAIARCSLSDQGAPSLDLVSSREYRSRALLKNYEMHLAATNACVAVSGNPFEVVFLGSPKDPERSQRLEAERVLFSAGRRLLIGSGDVPKVWATQNFSEDRNKSFAEPLRIICGSLTNGNSVAASDDLAVVAVQDPLATNPGLVVISFGGGSTWTNRVPLPNATFMLQSVHGREGNTSMLFTSLDADSRKVGVVLDINGKELSRSRLLDQPASDAMGTTVVSISPMAVTPSSSGGPISVKVWLPKEHREYILSLETATILSALKLTK